MIPNAPTPTVATPTSPPQTPEERVRSVQDHVAQTFENASPLYRQAVYQYLWALGHRITGHPHATLIDLAKKEIASETA
jgi:hypothetical protein